MVEKNKYKIIKLTVGILEVKQSTGVQNALHPLVRIL